jgi:hypothetical protein
MRVCASVLCFVCERISECAHIIDHDPSLAMYRLQEHTRKTVPALVNRKYAIMKLNNDIQGACFDLDNALQ